MKDGDAHGRSRDELLLASSGAPYTMKLRTRMSLRPLNKFDTLSPGQLVGTRSGAIMRATSPKGTRPPAGGIDRLVAWTRTYDPLVKRQQYRKAPPS